MSTRQSTKRSTRETAKFNHNPPCKAPFFAVSGVALPNCSQPATQIGTKEYAKKHKLEHAKWHEATHQKARTEAGKMARGSTPKSPNWSTQNGTREYTKKHELEHTNNGHR